jgi:hypothetical protein
MITQQHIDTMAHRRFPDHHLIQNETMYQSIQNLDVDMISEALANGAQINNGHFRTNTLNLCVRSLLTNSVKRFNAQIVEKLLEYGAKDHCSKNIYAHAMECYGDYLKLNQGSEDIASHNTQSLLQIFASNGFKSDDQAVFCALKTRIEPFIKIIINQIESNTNDSNTNDRIIKSVIRTGWRSMIDFTIDVFAQKNIPIQKTQMLHSAIKTKNMKIINHIIGYKPETDDQTVNHAIRSGDPQILRLMFINGALNNNSNNIQDNSLACALETSNLLIIKEVISKGSIPCTNDMGIIYFWFMLMKMRTDNDYMLELLMCAGLRVNDGIYNYIRFKEPKTKMEMKIKVCIGLLRGHTESMVYPMISVLRQCLMETMDMLMEWPYTKQDKINHIDQAMETLIPVPLINIIYEYQFESLVRYIDWSKY